MDFSPVFKQSQQTHCQWSPDGKYMAYTDAYRCIINNTDTLETLHIFTCVDVISKIEWSLDSNHIMCAQYTAGLCQVWSIQDKQWTCKIDEGIAGLCFAAWTPDARHIITISDFNLRLTIWSLLKKQVFYIQYPKFSSECGITYSPDGKYCSMLERNNHKDIVGVYLTDTWELVNQFPISTQDCQGISFASDSLTLACWDDVFAFKLLMYQINGTLVSTIANISETEKVSSSSTDNNVSLGIQNVEWSKGELALCAIAGMDQAVRVVNPITWKVLTIYYHETISIDENTIIYKEGSVDVDGQSNNENNNHNNVYGVINNATKGKSDINVTSSARYHVVDSNQKQSFVKDFAQNAISLIAYVQELKKQTQTTKLKQPKSKPAYGVNIVSWSPDGEFLATVVSSFPTSVWIWSTKTLTLMSLAVHKKGVTKISWQSLNKNENSENSFYSIYRLAITTKERTNLYIWSLSGCSIVKIPIANFQLRDLQWNPISNGLILNDRNKFCCCCINE